MTLNEIKAKHAGQFVWVGETQRVWDVDAQAEILSTEVLVWESEEESKDDDGSAAIAHYLIDCEG